MPEQTVLPLEPMKAAKPRVVSFDLETMRSADEVGGWSNIHKMGMACGVCYDSVDGQYHVYEEKDVADLIRHLQRADLVVGFNHVRFDYTVLRGYSSFDFNKLPNFDILLDVTERLGHRLKLDSLVTATLEAKKSADGLQSLKWVKEGRLDLVIDYCKKDVEVTKDLFEYGLREGKVLYYSRSADKVVLDVDWDLKNLITR